nr:helix-turn-helix transcriptional regulator [Solirhodobacter olei]
MDALRSARQGAGLTQQQVADRLGRPQSFVAKVEGYERRLDVVEFLHLCRAIGIDASAMIDKLKVEAGGRPPTRMGEAPKM